MSSDLFSESSLYSLEDSISEIEKGNYFPTFLDLNDYFLDENLAVDYLKEMHVFNMNQTCSKNGCRNPINYNEKKLTMVCSKCKSSKSIRKIGFFR